MPTNEHEHRFQAGCRGVSRVGKFEAEIAINSQRIRGPEFTPVPAKGVYRILLLGSSNALGLGVDESKTFPRALERKLARKYGGRFEVLNGAMFGYSSWQTATRLQPLLKAYRPHLVLYHLQLPSFLLFDAVWEPRMIRSPEGHPLGFDRSILGRDSSFQRLNQLFFYSTPVFLFLHTVHDQLRRIAFTWRSEIIRDGQAADRLLASTFRSMDYMRSTAAAAGAEFAFFSQPFHHYFYGQFVPTVMSLKTAVALSTLIPEPSFNSERVVKALGAYGAPSVYLREFHREPYLMEGEGLHLTAEGLDKMAEVFAERSGDLPMFKALRKGKRRSPNHSVSEGGSVSTTW